jgi:hypothetical protein
VFVADVPPVSLCSLDLGVVFDIRQARRVNLPRRRDAQTSRLDDFKPRSYAGAEGAANRIRVRSTNEAGKPLPAGLCREHDAKRGGDVRFR